MTENERVRHHAPLMAHNRITFTILLCWSLAGKKKLKIEKRSMDLITPLDPTSCV